MQPHAERLEWTLPAGVTYLNHGSFGLMPTAIKAACDRWRHRMDDQPMDFFVRHLEEAWFCAREKLASFVGADPANMALIDNATSGMNVAARSIALQPGDTVILNDHEYGAVRRIWERACLRQGVDPPIIATLPQQFATKEEVIDALWQHVNPTTRVLVVSHITSATAITLPIDAICRRAAAAGITTCIDGPHAVAQLPLSLDELGCDYYVASCHKWLCAPLGSGFLYVHPRHHSTVDPLVLSWGRIMPTRPSTWSEEFLWVGTRDFSPLLSLQETIDFWSSDRLAEYRKYSRELACYARAALLPFADRAPLVSEEGAWFTSMSHMPLPPGPCQSLQQALWDRFRIEIPVIDWHGERYIRVSCHLYNEPRHIDYLAEALRQLL